MISDHDDERFEFSGGALCLDFVNTLGDRPRDQNETLRSDPDLVAWATAAGLFEQEIRRPARQAAAGFDRAIELRESLYRIFSSLAAGGSPERRDLDLLNEHLRPALAHLRLGADEDEFRWKWTVAPNAPERLLWSVARSASELLISADRDRLRECASDRCSWLFLDHSRSRRRRWCDMKTCGNRAKARRHYRRRKAQDGDG